MLSDSRGENEVMGEKSAKSELEVSTLRTDEKDRAVAQRGYAKASARSGEGRRKRARIHL